MPHRLVRENIYKEEISSLKLKESIVMIETIEMKDKKDLRKISEKIENKETIEIKEITETKGNKKDFILLMRKIVFQLHKTKEESQLLPDHLYRKLIFNLMNPLDIKMIWKEILLRTFLILTNKDK